MSQWKINASEWWACLKNKNNISYIKINLEVWQRITGPLARASFARRHSPPPRPCSAHLSVPPRGTGLKCIFLPPRPVQRVRAQESAFRPDAPRSSGWGWVLAMLSTSSGPRMQGARAQIQEVTGLCCLSLLWCPRRAPWLRGQQQPCLNPTNWELQ